MTLTGGALCCLLMKLKKKTGLEGIVLRYTKPRNRLLVNNELKQTAFLAEQGKQLCKVQRAEVK